MEDCQKAVHLDSTLIKAHFFMGQALIELECYDEAIVSLKTGEHNMLHLKFQISAITHVEQAMVMNSACRV